MIYSLDIETACNLGCEGKCDHALVPHQASITCIGIHCESYEAVFRDLNEFKEWIPYEATFVGHGFKFDLKHLKFHGIDLRGYEWHDTSLMAATITEKIPTEWLDSYEKKRVEENKKLARGYSHRKAKGLSLKTLAPYFLKVEPFWETPENHDDDDYVLKDAEYTFRLFKRFSEILRKEDSWDFYEKKYLEWAKMLLDAEVRGIKLDLELLHKQQSEAASKAASLQLLLDEEWEDAYQVYRDLQTIELRKKYDEQTDRAIARLKDKNKAYGTALRNQKKFIDAASKLETKLNLNSPDQVLWLLRDHFKLDVEVRARDKDTGQIDLKDSTGVEVLQRLAKSGRSDIQKFLDFREQTKLATAFFPTYLELSHEGTIHTNFNATGTRTGRLSSDTPNLQQVPGDLHDLFVARPGYKLACFDMSAIEARMIAYYSEDPILYGMMLDQTDIHGFHTKIFFELECEANEVKKLHKNLRDVTKNIGFGLFYGAGANRIQQEAIRNGFKWSDAECREKARRFKETYEGVTAFKKYIDNEAENGKIIRNVLGRPFSFPNTEEIYMKCFNTLIQSSASDLVLQSAAKIRKEFKEKGIDGHILLLVHDEIVTEIPEDRVEECKEIIVRNMTDYDLPTSLGPIKLEVEGSIDDYWKK